MNTELIEVLDSVASDIIEHDSLITQADNLAAQHENFHSNYIVAGRTALYGLLASIYELAEKLDCHLDKEGQLMSMRSILAEKYDIRTQGNTPDLTVLVRYVTRADRKTAHIYARAIETAKIHQIPPDQLAGYLEKQGGIEKIRAKGAAGVNDAETDEDLEERVELTKRYLDARNEFPINSFKVGKSQLQQLGDLSGFSLLICSESEGRISVLAKAPYDPKLEKRVIESIAQRLPEELKPVRKNIERFHAKAMKKRSRNTLKEIIKKRPALAPSMLRLQRIRAETDKRKREKECNFS